MILEIYDIYKKLETINNILDIRAEEETEEKPEEETEEKDIEDLSLSQLVQTVHSLLKT